MSHSSQVDEVEYFGKQLKQDKSAVFVAHVLTCHSRKSNGLTNNDGCIPCR